jgi:predicted nucleotide-binding protein
MTPSEELFELARKLDSAYKAAELSGVISPLDAIDAASNEVERSFSGSWLGYHSRVYYDGLKPPPPGANFSKEWGLKEMIGDLGSRGKWREFDYEHVKEYVLALAGKPNLEAARRVAEDASAAFSQAKPEITSILQMEVDHKSDAFLEKLKGDIDQLVVLSSEDVAQHLLPKGQVITRDSLAAGQGIQVPPHIVPLTEVASIRDSFNVCKAAAEISRKAASHLERRSRRMKAEDRIGTNVFIGHGRSAAWRELKDFIQDRLRLPWDEFNRVPVAGITNIARLSEMLDAASIALLVMTAEDEMAEGGVQARMNVVHEAGLFQGRLGFTRAIVLLEEGCAEFSNIQGLGQIRFPQNNIAACFEEVRRVMEREKLIEQR